MMAKVGVFIWHDASGSIFAVGRPVADSVYKVTPLTEKNQFVLHTDVEESTLEKLAETHKVDVHNKTLIASQPSGKTG